MILWLCFRQRNAFTIIAPWYLAFETNYINLTNMIEIRDYSRELYGFKKMVNFLLLFLLNNL